MLLGSMLAYLRHVPGYLWVALNRWLIYSVEVPSSDYAFLAVSNYLEKNKLTDNWHSFKINTNRIWKNREDESDEKTTGSKISSLFYVLYKPLNELRWFKYNGSTIFFFCRQEKVTTTSSRQGTTPELYYEIFTFKALFKSGHKAIQDLVTKSLQELSLGNSNDLDIKILNDSWASASWIDLKHKPKRPLSTVALPASSREEILADAKKFFENKDWYTQRGLPYRRGYMLHGAPGNGKSSLITALASELDRPVYMISLKSFKDESAPNKVFNTIPEGSIIALEDVDTVQPKREGSDNPDEVSLAAVLNALDGVAGQTGSLVIMTTNNLDSVDPAMKRPGRTDKIIEFTNCTTEQLSQMIDLFYPDYPHKQQTLDNYKSESLSVSTVQERLLMGEPLITIGNITNV